MVQVFPFHEGDGVIIAYSDWYSAAQDPHIYERRSTLYREVHDQALVINLQGTRTVAVRGSAVRSHAGP